MKKKEVIKEKKMSVLSIPKSSYPPFKLFAYHEHFTSTDAI